MFQFNKNSLFNQKRFNEKYNHKNSVENSSGSIYKNSFLEDLERIIFCSANRRMQDKAQVYPLEERDFVRSRLTHSLEVSAVASALGNTLFKRLHKKINDLLIKSKNQQNNKMYNDTIANSFAHKGLIVSYTERDRLKNYELDLILCLQAASLIHDFGNPPFGHFGEDVIKEYFKDIFFDDIQKEQALKYDHFKYVKNLEHSKSLSGFKKKIFDGLENIQMIYDNIYFDGNAQAFRIVTKLQKFNKKTPGLNLTFGVLGSLFKYPYSSIYSSENHQKFGYFYSENAEIKKLSNNKKGNDWGVFKEFKRNPLAILMEAADDISFTFSDFEDSVQKGHIRYDDITNIIKLIRKDQKFSNGLTEKELKECEGFLKIIFKKYNKNQSNKAPNQERFRKSVYETLISEYKNKIIYSCIDKFLSEDTYYRIMTGDFTTYKDNKKVNLHLVDESSMHHIHKLLNYIKRNHVFSNYEIITAELQGKKILEFLLDTFLAAVFSDDFDSFIEDRYKAKKNNEKILQLLSKNFIELYINDKEKYTEEEKVYYKIRLVIDHICSMTDSYAKDIYMTLNGK